MSISRVSFHPAGVGIMAWHLRVELDVAVPARIKAVRIDGAELDDYVLVQDGRVVPCRVADGSHGVRKPAQYVSSASAGGEFLAGRGTPELALFCPWVSGQEYAVEVDLSVGDTDLKLSAQARAPGQSGFPFPGWARHGVYRFRETAGLERTREPVELMLSAYQSECGSWARELRVAVADPATGSLKPVPFQVMREATSEHTASKRQETCTTAWVTVFVDAEAGAEVLLVAAWGQPQAVAADMDGYEPDLRTETDTGGWLSVSNSHFVAGLCPRSGQLGSLRGQRDPDHEFCYTPGGDRERRFLHYNPDLWVPDQIWSHTCDWDPPPSATRSEGPLVTRTRRWGDLPGVDSVYCCVEYTFYAWSPWIRTRTVLEVNSTLTTNAIRNEEIVMNADQADCCAWRETDGCITDQPIKPDPALPSGVAAIIRNEAPWIAFYDQASGAGVAGIRIGEQATTRGSAERAYWNTGTLVADYGWGFRYWSRSLIYGTGDFWPDREFVVEPGLLYTDECAYMPVHVDAEGEQRFAAIDAAEARLRQPLERVWSGSGPY
jgi:hypothetical protein